MVEALKTGGLDAIEAVPATAIKTLRSSGFVVSKVPGLDQTDFIINSNPKKKHHRELLNLKVKEAFDHAIDRKKIDSVTWLGAAQPANSIIPATTGSWHNPHLKTRELQPQAREPDPRQARLQEGLRRDSRGEGAEDVLQRHHPDRRAEHPAHVPDPPDRLREDRRAAEAAGTGLDRRVRPR
jgi:ABC-type dipeptide transport system, periplasmic component